ncbi:MAG: PQQ-binding-like beta-propeller repeat protein [Lachnospiraceae bacterium]|nr:PQQ-binding-like beta-propeller repeat protein [Lachnospiraceae bacterium]
MEKEIITRKNIENKEIRYDAFISYRHTQPDMFVAQTLHRELEAFRLPKHIKKKLGPEVKTKINRIFRDKDELPLASNLADPITEALSGSEYLIVICSPRLPESLWCRKEIQTFISMHGREKVFAVLIEGEPKESFPEELLYKEEAVPQEDGSVTIVKVPVEPLAADVRGNSNKERKKKIKEEMLRLLAPMFGCTYDELRQRHRERKIRRMLTLAAAVSAVCFVFGAISSSMALRIHGQNQEIKSQSMQIEEQNAWIEAQYQESLKINAGLQADEAFRLLEEGDRIAAVKTSVEALTGGEDFQSEGNKEFPYVPAAEYALSESLGVYYDGWSIVPEFLLKHDTNVVWMKTSPDQKTILTVDEAKEIYLWEAESGKNLCKIEDYTNQEYLDEERIIFQDNKRIAILTRTGVDVLDLSGQKIEEIAVGEGDEWRFAGLVGDGAGSHFLYILPEQVIVYDSQSYTELYRIEANEEMKFTHEAVIDPEEKVIALSMESETMYYQSIHTGGVKERPAEALVADLDTGEIINEYSLGYEWVEKLFFAEGMLYMLSNSNLENAVKDDGTESGIFAYAHGRLTGCDLRSGGEVKWCYDSESSLRDINVSRTADNDTVMLVSGEEIIALHGTDGSLIDRTGCGGMVVQLDVIEGTANFTVYTENGRQIYVYMTKDGINFVEFEGKFRNNSDEVKQIAFAEGGKILLLPYRSNSVTVMDSLLGEQYEMFMEGVSTSRNCIDADGLENHLLFVSEDKMSLICVKEDGTQVWRKELQEPVTAVMFFTETSSKIVMQQGDRITVYHKHTGEEILSYVLDADEYNIRLAGAYIEVMDYLTIKRYDTMTGELLYEKDLSEIYAYGDALAWDAGGIAIASVEEGIVRLYDEELKEILGEMELNTPFIDKLFLAAGTACGAHGQPQDMELYVSYKDGKLEHYYFNGGSGFQLRETIDGFEDPIEIIESGFVANKMEAYEIRDAEITAKIPGFLARSHSYYYVAGSGEEIWRVPVYSVDMLLEEAEPVLQ